MSVGREQQEAENWVLGVVLGLLGSIAINTGNNIQSLGLKNLQKEYEENEKNPALQARKRRRSTLKNVLEKSKTVPVTIDEEIAETDIVTNEHDFNENITRQNNIDRSESDDKQISPVSSLTWVLGTFIFVSGSLLNFASYAFAAQSLLASLESIQFVTNIIFGKFMLGANVTRTMLVGTALTVFGTLIAVQFSSKDTLDLNTEQVKALYLNPAYIAYIALMTGLLFVIDILYRYLEKNKGNENELKYTDTLMPVAYSIWSALFGTQSVVQAKVLAELLAVHSNGEEDIFKSWFTYFTLVIWLLTVGVWLKRLNGALSMFDPLFIIPLLQCSFIFFAIVSGGIFFKEFNDFTPTQWIGFWSGVSVMFGGLIMLTPKKKAGIESSIRKEVSDLLIATGHMTNGRKLSLSAGYNGKNNYTKCIPTTPPPSPRKSVKAKLENEENTPLYHVVSSPFKNKHKKIVPETPNPKHDKNSNSPQTLPENGVDIHLTTTDEDNINHSTSLNRSLRPSLGRSAVSTVKDVMYESASILLLSSHNGTGAMTDAMVAATERKEKKRERREQLARLRKILTTGTQTLSDEISEELRDLINELGLDSQNQVNGTNLMCDNTFTENNHNRYNDRNKSDSQCTDRLTQNVSPRTYKKSILIKANELEQKLDNASDSERDKIN